jgi:GNAT superfamily N-acetyltransferase
VPRSVEHLVWRFASEIDSAEPPSGVEFRPGSAADVAALEHLAAAVADCWPGPARPSAAGWAGDLRSRSGRTVRAWLAWETLGAGNPPVPRGFVTLVTTAAAAGPRHAIGWLVVDPAARRRGIARALVAEALGAARRHGAEAVWVETAVAWREGAVLWEALGFEPG